VAKAVEKLSNIYSTGFSLSFHNIPPLSHTQLMNRIKLSLQQSATFDLLFLRLFWYHCCNCWYTAWEHFNIEKWAAWNVIVYSFCAV